MQKVIEIRSFIAALIAVSIAFTYLMLPFFSVILWACIIALLFHPLHAKLLDRYPRHENIAALVTLLACVLIAVTPALFLASSFIKQGTAIYQQLESGQLKPALWIDQIRQAFPVIDELLRTLGFDVAEVKQQLGSLSVEAGKVMASNALLIGQNTLGWLVSLGLMLYLTFFMLRDGARLIPILIRALPLGDERERLLMQKFAEVTRATIKGSLVVAMAQGSLGGLIFWLLDLPGPVLWGVVMTVLSLIPVVGASLIWLPVGLYLLATGNTSDGIILIAFGAIVIGLVDNILRPILVGRDTKLPDYLVLLSTLGGFTMFGMTGFVLGPLIAVLFITFWEIFSREFNVILDGDAMHDDKSADDRDVSSPPL
ncbi:AI-2E family transporter [Aequoribacter fuscus]|nr:AI-2E family transporter [Aequoribacter fuscus]QHJ87446.1 AI-2E family transporter [Aequoribacter fuscus]